MRGVSCFYGFIDRVSRRDHCVVPSGDYVNCGPNGVERLSCFDCLTSTVSPIVDTWIFCAISCHGILFVIHVVSPLLVDWYLDPGFIKITKFVLRWNNVDAGILVTVWSMSRSCKMWIYISNGSFVNNAIFTTGFLLFFLVLYFSFLVGQNNQLVTMFVLFLMLFFFAQARSTTILFSKEFWGLSNIYVLLIAW